jgi:A/G-specific adenine glycosylase
VDEEIGLFRHAYSHFKVVLHAFKCKLQAGEPRPLESDGLEWVEVNRLGRYAMGKINRMIAGKI